MGEKSQGQLPPAESRLDIEVRAPLSSRSQIQVIPLAND